MNRRLGRDDDMARVPAGFSTGRIAEPLWRARRRRWQRLTAIVALLCCAVIPTPAASAAQAQKGHDTDLVAAIRNGEQATVRKLLARGANILARDEAGATPLMHAALNADIAVMQLLLDNGASVNAETPTKSTALLWGLHDADKVKLLLEHGARVSDDTIYGASSLPRGAKVLKLFADAGSNLNLSKNGYTTLMAASRSGSLETFQLLIAKSGDVRARNRIGFTALYGAAFWRGSRPIVQFLLEHGSDSNARVQLSVPGVDVLTTLMGGAMHGDAEIVRVLLENGADCNVQGGDFGRTALLLAATTGSAETVKLLLERGADVNATDHLGNSALQWARRRGDARIVEILVAAGANDRAHPRQPSEQARLQPKVESGAIERALARSLPLIQRSGLAFSERKSCVSCHHQSLVAMAVGSARKSGFPFDATIAAQEHVRIINVLAKSREGMLAGSGVTDELAPAYILAGLDAAGHKPDQISDALVQFLVLRQQPDGSWTTPVYRPPQDASDITFTALAIRGLASFAPQGRAHELADRIAQARAWLEQAEARETEDVAFRLLGLTWARASRRQIDGTRTRLLREQRADGGWAQLPALTSDAYATGLALVALHESDGSVAIEPGYRRGIEYLLRTQLADGSWFVQTRSFPLQPFVGTHFPYGRSQFISLAATCWASMALSLENARRTR
jgi:ankyrin repeat protein